MRCSQILLKFVKAVHKCVLYDGQTQILWEEYFWVVSSEVQKAI